MSEEQDFEWKISGQAEQSGIFNKIAKVWSDQKEGRRRNKEEVEYLKNQTHSWRPSDETKTEGLAWARAEMDSEQASKEEQQREQEHQTEWDRVQAEIVEENKKDMWNAGDIKGWLEAEALENPDRTDKEQRDYERITMEANQKHVSYEAGFILEEERLDRREMGLLDRWGHEHADDPYKIEMDRVEEENQEKNAANVNRSP